MGEGRKILRKRLFNYKAKTNEKREVYSTVIPFREEKTETVKHELL